MYKLLLILPLFLFFSQFSSAQGLVWAKQIGGTKTERGNSLAVDRYGNVYTTGSFLGTADVDPGPTTLNFTSAGNKDIFIQKLDASGGLVWAKRIGGEDNDYGVALTLDSIGNIYVVGRFGNTVDFDPGPGTAILNQLSALFILKLDADGNFIWVKSIDDASFYSRELDDSFGNCIRLDAQGNIYLTAGFHDTTDFDPGPDSVLLTAPAFVWDAFLLKLDAQGDFVWVKQISSVSYDSGMALELDRDGNIYTTGYFTKTADFDPGPGVFNLTATGINSVKNDIFIQKLDADGNFVWAKALGYYGYDDFGHALTLDQQGNVYVTGSFYTDGSTMDFDPGPGTYEVSSNFKTQIFILKLDTDGDFVWVKIMAGQYGHGQGKAICTDAEGNLYTTGYFGETVDFDPGPDTANLTADGFGAFIQKLDTAGNFLWARMMGGTVNGFTAQGRSISIDPTGNIYLIGNFNNTADFDPNSNVFNLISAGSDDIFILKLTQGYEFQGTVFNDQNGNGLLDAGEPGIPNVLLAGRNSGIYASTDSLGKYRIYNDIAGDTLIAVLPAQLWYDSITTPFRLPTTLQEPQDFAVFVPSDIRDVAVTAVELSAFRPGAITDVIIQVHNYSSAPVDSVWVVFHMQTQPNPLTFLSADPAPVFISGDSLVWFLDSLGLAAVTSIRLQLRALSSTPIGTSISSETRVRMAGDQHLINNFFGNRWEVVGSYDPNDKQVIPEHFPLTALDSTELRYVVRFQNTGNYPADRVVIRDTLPAGLDISSIQLISASHAYSWRLYDAGILEVYFDPIFLPDSLNDEPGSHGFVAFTIRPKNNLAMGDSVRNRVGIYFDFNPPVMTNWAVTRVETVSGINEIGAREGLEFGLSPNPVAPNSLITLDLPKLESAAKITVFDMQGRLIQQGWAPAGNRRAQLSGLSAGSYWVRVQIGKLSGAKMLVVE